MSFKTQGVLYIAIGGRVASQSGQYEEIPFGPACFIIFKTKCELKRLEGSSCKVPAHCAPILELLARNFGNEVSLEILEKALPGKTTLIQTITDIRNLLKDVGVPKDVVDIPRARPGEGYVLRDRQKPKPKPIISAKSSDVISLRGHEQKLQSAVSDSVEAQLEVFNGLFNRSSAIKIFPRWSDADIAVIMAQKTVLIVDSYYDEHPRLEWLLGAMRNHDCLVSIYMATPDMDFGAQRRREWESLEDRDYSGVKRKLATILSDKEREDYEHDFDKVCDDIARCAKKENVRNKNIKCELFEYPAMLSLRFIVIDDKEIIWGFYPLFDTNPNYPCLLLSWADDLNESDKNLFEKLMLQVDHIKKISVPKVARENRPRHNFHRNICSKMAAIDRVQAEGKSFARTRRK